MADVEREIAREQQHVDRAYARLDELKARARSVSRAGYEAGTLSTPQSRVDRDTMVFRGALRLANLELGAEPLVFGRVDRSDGDALHVGRIGVRSSDHDPLVVDWRAPAAAPFYQATAGDRQGLVRRRVIHCEQQKVIGLSDDLLDPDADIADLGIVGDGALLAAVNRARGETMRDIVATIQREQDEVIRAPTRGALLVTGGPGTGKTVVALHRAAYLLYEERNHLEESGVLVVGPTGAFLSYIGQVLPSLGEHSVRLMALTDALDGVSATHHDAADIAATKGSERMAEVLRQLLVYVLPPVERGLRVTYRTQDLTVPAERLLRIRADRVNGKTSYNGARQAARRAVLEALWRDWERNAPPDGRSRSKARADFFAEMGAHPRVHRLLRLWWPPLEAGELFDRLRRGALPLHAISDGVLSAGEVEQLNSAWEAADGYSIHDVALLDELNSLVGTPPSEDEFDTEDEQPAEEVTTYQDRISVRRSPSASDPGYRNFGHVVVDEAQDLSPMQWRMIGRRAPYASWTIVGDWAQSAWTDPEAARATMETVVGRQRIRQMTLTTNYRTPAEIAELAGGVLQSLDPDAVLPTSVREGGHEPAVYERQSDVAGTVREQVAAMEAELEGTVAVITPMSRRDEVAGWLPASTRARVLDALTVKGLEFDGAVVAAPEEIVAESPVGVRTLYVALTRATQRLAVVSGAANPLPTAT